MQRDGAALTNAALSTTLGPVHVSGYKGPRGAATQGAAPHLHHEVGVAVHHAVVLDLASHRRAARTEVGKHTLVRRHGEKTRRLSDDLHAESLSLNVSVSRRECTVGTWVGATVGRGGREKHTFNDKERNRGNEACPVSTGGGTRRVQSVREEGRDVSSQYGREGGGIGDDLLRWG